MDKNNNLVQLSFYDEEVKEQFHGLDSEVLDFLNFFIKNYKFDNVNNKVLIAKVNKTKLTFNGILCQINGEYFDIFFSTKYINVEGREIRLCYKKENGYHLEDKIYKLDNGGKFIYKKNFPYNLIFSFPNEKFYKVHLECDDLELDKKILEYFHNHIPYAKRMNDLLKILLNIVDVNNAKIEIRNNDGNLLMENAILKEYNEYYEKDNIKYHIYLKDNEIYVDKTIIQTEKLNKDDIIDVKQYQKTLS